ncbi:enoyl-CoA hydratase/isomerase family protein [Paraburkholderia sp. LEh10]|uniref:enoyl-CoA hydratase/isomerase family protein n=1 Tax=Paraburkholderia sp. LEh10 TaxID=2821353 RepID=UPI001AE90C9E|nr:enoyl-CoA hydratase/isomerase family protein [Paraburkholderia sp. LEh10]MBP0591520.1 enoyl-CoA hydratase/isomerase family protein [Paraburkholderia sp. LEh10]
MSYTKTLVDSVAWLTMDRPSAMNSLNREMATGLTAQLNAWRHDEAVRVVVLTGNGRAFCAGADLIEAAEPPHPDKREFLDLIVEFFDTLRAFPKPVIAAVNGLALAGGLEVVLASDLVLAAESARLGDAHSNFGAFPGAGGAAILPRKVPANVARYLLFTGDAMSAAELKGYGLVNEVLADAELKPRAQALAERLAKKSPLVLARMKRVANEAADKSAADALRHELLELRNHQRSYDIQEGLRAFAEKREPQFKGC